MKRLVRWGSGVALALAIGFTVPTQRASASTTTTSAAARQWYQQVLATLGPLSSSLPAGVQAVGKWEKGKESVRATGRQITRTLSGLNRAQHGLTDLPVLAGYATVRREYIDAIGLYINAFHLAAAATLLPKGQLVGQVQRSFERVRELGDLTFDQGTATLAPLLGPSLAGSDVAAATRVPDWLALKLAPGAPLLADWVGTTVQPTGTQPLAGWLQAVQKANLPSEATLQTAVHARRRATLQRLVTALDYAEVALCPVPPPATNAQASALLRLGLLVDADGLLAAESASLSRGAPARSFLAAADALRSIGVELRTFA